MSSQAGVKLDDTLLYTRKSKARKQVEDGAVSFRTLVHAML